jgi:hypothetical protein
MTDLRKGKSILYAKVSVEKVAIGKVANDAAKSVHDEVKITRSEAIKAAKASKELAKNEEKFKKVAAIEEAKARKELAKNEEKIKKVIAIEVAKASKVLAKNEAIEKAKVARANTEIETKEIAAETAAEKAAVKARNNDKRRKSIERLVFRQEHPDIIETALDIDVKNFCTGYNKDSIFITCGCCGQELGGSEFANELLTVEELSILKTSLDKWVDFLSSCNTDAQFTRALIENVPNGALRGCEDFCMYNYYNYQFISIIIITIIISNYFCYFKYAINILLII